MSESTQAAWENTTTRPWPEPKPGQAKPKPTVLAWLGIFGSQSHIKPGQSHGFQAKPKPAHHYSSLQNPFAESLLPDLYAAVTAVRLGNTSS